MAIVIMIMNNENENNKWNNERKIMWKTINDNKRKIIMKMKIMKKK